MQIDTGNSFEDKRAAFKTLFMMNILDGKFTLNYCEEQQLLQEKKEDYAAAQGIKDALELFIGNKR
tara:strand:+ start:1939 stop:2136 length:198 start_codon:yes stop_codon:yes gene_type:complete